jgi:type II secretory pathway pseudopilin PulG
MNPSSASAAEDSGRMPAAGSSGLRPVLGLGKLPAARGHPAAHLNLNESAPPSPISHIPYPTRPKAAFTLIELMVAAAITTLLLLGMTGIFDQSMKAWRLSSRRADAEREVRGALAQIRRDLSCIVVNSNLPIAYNWSRLTETNRINVGSSAFQRTAANFPPRAGPTSGTLWSNASVVLFFATAQNPSATDPGDLSGVGYYVTWDPNSNQGRGAYNLYRRFQTPQDLLAGIQVRLTNSLRGPYQINSLSDPELVGANVFNFWVQMVGIRTNVSPPNPFNMAAGPPDNTSTGTNITTRPSYVQLELTAYGSEQVQGFSQQDWANSNNIRKFGRTFIWRVDL